MAKSTQPLLPMWYRVLTVIFGIFVIAVALIVLIYPYFAVWLLIFLLALALLIMGMDRLVAGISGHPFTFMTPFFEAMAAGDKTQAPTQATPPAQTPPKANP